MTLFEPLLGMLAVAFCWGFTNPLIQRGSRSLTQATRHAQSFRQPIRLLAHIALTALHWQFSVPLAVNLSGSLLYYYTLANAPLSVVVPVCTSLTFAATAAGDVLLKNQVGGKQTALGIAMVTAGVACCVAAAPGPSDGNQT